MATLRSILRELNRSGVKPGSPVTQHLIKLHRKYQVTDEQVCNEKAEMDYVAKTYLTYLRSSRKLKELNEEYGSRELTVRQTADMVGFKLPNDP